MSHPPPPPVDYYAPRRNKRRPWRPWWLSLLRWTGAGWIVRADEARRERYERECADLTDS
jgi:hypothetical protein